jgi:uncharacterized DUF497 family protein
MKTEWDSAKAASNLRKHGIDFSDAAVALEDRNALTIEDSEDDRAHRAERRHRPDYFSATGRPERNRLLLRWNKP